MSLQKRNKKNSLLMLVSSYPPAKGGVQIVAQQYAQLYKELGYCVQIITTDARQTQRKKERIGAFGEKITSFRVDLNIQSVPFSWGFFMETLKIASKLEKNFHLLIHHPAPQDSLLSIILFLLFRCKLRIVFHAEIVNKNKILTFFSEPFVKLSLFLAHQIIFTTKKMKDLCQDRYKVNGKSFVISIANTSTIEEKILPKKRVLNKALQLIFIGRLVPYKGLSFLIESLSGIDGVYLNIVGDGKNKTEIEALIHKFNLSKKITLYGNLCDKEKHYLLKEADVFIFPSITKAEAFGIAQIEAMQFGLPVINTNIPSGVPEVSKHGVSGLTVSPRNTNELKESIVRLRDDPILYQKLSKGAISRSKDFHLDIIRAQFKTITPEKIETWN